MRSFMLSSVPVLLLAGSGCGFHQTGPVDELAPLVRKALSELP